MRKKAIHIISGFMLSVLVFGFTAPTALSSLHCDMMMEKDSTAAHSEMLLSSEPHHEMNMTHTQHTVNQNTSIDCDCVYMSDSGDQEALFFKKTVSFQPQSKLSFITTITSDLLVEKKPKQTVSIHSPPLLFIRHSSLLI